MAAAITCYLGDFRLGGNTPAINDLRVHPNAANPVGQSLGNVFLPASGPAALNISLDSSRRNSVAQIPHFKTVSVADLSGALETLLTGASQPAVGLLLADYFEPDGGQYGCMFDLDTQDPLVGPRQGCAIFVSGIQVALNNAGRGGDANALLEFVAFTAMHEMGHAFNLWHVADSYMQPFPHPESPGPYQFVDQQQQYLALAANPDDARFVLPGHGSSNYGDRPEGWSGLDDSNPFAGAAARSRSPILKIGLSHQSFHTFEPVELNVTVSLPPGLKKPVEIPNEIDPGYDSFQIWITEPTGERRRYRPLMRFCRSHGSLTISAKEPYRRDISFFRQSGRSTFKVAGRHLIQVAFGLSARSILWSNEVACEVKISDPSSETWVQARHLLDSPEARHLLRLKSTLPGKFDYSPLIRYASKGAPRETAAAIHYALGKSLLTLAARAPSSTPVRNWHRQGLKHLSTALKTRALGVHRRRVIETLLERKGVLGPQ